LQLFFRPVDDLTECRFRFGFVLVHHGFNDFPMQPDSLFFFIFTEIRCFKTPYDSYEVFDILYDIDEFFVSVQLSNSLNFHSN